MPDNKKENQTKTIVVSTGTWSELMRLKINGRWESLDKLILHLLKKYRKVMEVKKCGGK